jgi:hypothetical protein
VLCTQNDGRDFGEVWDLAENVETNRTKSPAAQMDVLRIMDCALFFWQRPEAQEDLGSQESPRQDTKRTLDVVAPGKRANLPSA